MTREHRIPPRIPVPRMDPFPGRGAWGTADLPIRMHGDESVFVDTECGHDWTPTNQTYIGVAFRLENARGRTFVIARSDGLVRNDRELLAWSVKVFDEIRRGRIARKPKQKLRGEYENKNTQAAVHC